jgi:nucleoside-diphosphate-sugar epimerase
MDVAVVLRLNTMKVLVLGGSNLIGPALVSELLADQADVTVATRGLTPDPFEDLVSRVKIERSERASLQTLASMRPWDVIYDQICFTAVDAKMACDCFAGRVGRYVFTSSVVVYAPASDLAERDFDPYNFPAHSQVDLSALPQHLRYAEGKRAAEAVFFQQAKFPVAAVRFPNILGANDKSRRLDWHVDFVQKHLPIFVPSPKVRQSLVWSEDVGRFLKWLGSQSYTGPINAASSDPISVGDLLEIIAATLGSSVVYAEERTRENHSPFGLPEDFTINTQLAKTLGFEFVTVANWLPQLIGEQVTNGPRRFRDTELHLILEKLHRRGGLTADDLKLLGAHPKLLQRPPIDN